MAKTLSTYLDLTSVQARAQWVQIGHRVWPESGGRQEAFLPVEVLLCYGLFWVVNPHSYGGANIHKAPEELLALARVFKRAPGSLTSKMLNLEGARSNCAKLEPELYAWLAARPDHFVFLYHTVMQSAHVVFGEGHIPDILGLPSIDHSHLLLGQDELGHAELAKVLEEEEQNRRMLEVEKGLREMETVRVVQQRARLGQHRFAKQVLSNYDHTCAFCGFAPHHIAGYKMLLASHIKPWRDSNNRERLDPRNGIAACPVHDTAFDTGLLTVNGGLRIHRSDQLEASIGLDSRAEDYFGERGIGDRLIVPATGSPPRKRYLDWHKSEIFLRSV